MFRKKLSIMMIFAMIFTMIPNSFVSFAAVSTDYTTIEIKEEGQTAQNISNGEENIRKELEYISIRVNPELTLIDQSKLADIAIRTKDIDEKYKFDTVFSGGKLKLSIKKSGETRLYNLLDKKTYMMHFPAGLFKNSDASKLSSAYDISFITGSNFYTGYGPDISSAELSRLDKSNADMNLYFIDSVALKPNVEGQEKNIKIRETDYQTKTSRDVTDSFNIAVNVQNDKLITMSPKSSYEIKDFTRYSVSLKEGAVYLSDTVGQQIAQDARIEIAQTDVAFESDRIVSNAEDFRYPSANAIEVERNPRIKLKFKDAIEVLDKSKLKIVEKVNGSYNLSNPTISIDPSYVEVNGEEKIVEVRLDKDGASKLDASKSYQIYLESGFARAKAKTDYDGNKIENKAGYTGEFTVTSDSQSPSISKYSSDSQGSDDIRTVDGTKLDGLDTIYLTMSEDVKVVSGKTVNDIKSRSKLYRLPKPTGTAYDSNGMLYNTGYDYHREAETVVSCVYDTDGTTMLYQEEVDIESISVSGNQVSIQPKLKWEDNSQYRFILDREYIVDSNGNQISSNPDFVFFTDEKQEEGTPVWIDPKTSEENNLDPYSPTRPIELKVASEVVLNLSQRVHIGGGKTNFTGLAGLRISEQNNSTATIRISKAEIRYDRNSSNKTTIKLYPESQLALGTGYKLEIPENTFQGRNAKPLASMTYLFSTKADPNAEMLISSLSQNEIASIDLSSQEKIFYIHGKNFDAEKIASVAVQGESGNAQDKPVINFPETDFTVMNTAKIAVTIKGEVKEKLSKEGYTGTYLVKLKLKDNFEVVSPVDKLKIIGRGKPKLIETTPTNNNMIVDEKELKLMSGKDRSYIRFTFEDKDGSLVFNYEDGLSLLKSSRLYSDGSETNLVDIVYLSDIENKMTGTIEEKVEAELFKKENGKAHLYIPIKELRSNTKYFMHIDGNIVRYDLTTGFIGSDPHDLVFATRSVPVVSRIVQGTIDEDYDEDEPIVIYGDFFLESSLEVYFNDEKARKHEIKEDENGNKYLEVYLPDDDDRLEPGTYNVQVRNSDNHTTTEFGVLSVIKSSDKTAAPDDEYRYGEDVKQGEIKEHVKISSDTLRLERKYTDESEVYLDLNKIFGREAKVMNIEFRGSSSNIGELQLKSVNFNAVLYRVRGERGEDAVVKVGKADEALKSIVSRKLVGRTPVSEYIQIAGSNYELSGLVLEIPLKAISPTMKVMRYDEKTRSLYNERFTIDRESKKARILSDYQGVFIVVD